MKKIIPILLVTTLSLFAALDDNLSAINSKIVALNGSVESTQISADMMCAPLVALTQESKALKALIDTTNATLTAPISVTTTTLANLEAISANLVTLSSQSAMLGNSVSVLAANADAITIKSGLDAMLQLSSDIGTMADRIGLMADKILVMSDNIGLMADRIIATQQIQSVNLATTQNTILATQANMLALVSVVETLSYNVSMDTLIAQGNLLVARMMAVTLSPLTMKSELQSVRDEVRLFLGQIQAFGSLVSSDQLANTMYINELSLTSLMNLSIMMRSFATVLDGYVIAIEAAQSVTTSYNLKDAMASMLIMSADIGKMANAILLMADQILAMADNIGMQADQILVVQQQQTNNIGVTQASILAAQEMAIAIIKARALD